MNMLENMAWDIGMDTQDNSNFTENNQFGGCIPLKHLFGFCEDYKKVMINVNQQIILNRSSTDLDALCSTGTNEKNQNVIVKINKILWKMPVVKVSDREKIKLLKVLDSKTTLQCAFRNWDLCEYPSLPASTYHSWTVKSSSLLEKPRFAIIGFQTARKNNLLKPSARFDSCQLKNLKVHLNSEVYPYEDFRADFSTKITAILYKAYTDFQKSYYDQEQAIPLLSRHIFQEFAPIVVVDLSRQNDNVKSSTVDMRIEFETSTAIPTNTAAYCLILHDQIVTYNPFNGNVRKL